VYAPIVPAGERRGFELRPGRHAWLQVVNGELEAAGHRLGAGDGLALFDEPGLELEALTDAELLLFDLA